MLQMCTGEETAAANDGERIRHTLRIAGVCAAATILFSTDTLGQTYPSRPIPFIVPGAGSGASSDLYARLIERCVGPTRGDRQSRRHGWFHRRDSGSQGAARRPYAATRPSDAWHGVLAPAKVDPAIIMRLNREIVHHRLARRAESTTTGRRRNHAHHARRICVDRTHRVRQVEKGRQTSRCDARPIKSVR